MEVVRVLQIVTGMKRAGLETMLMNYYRRIDRSRIQFDFLEHTLTETAYDDEIRQLGGRIFRLPPVNPVSARYRMEEKNFYRNHAEYKIVHSHLNTMSGLALSFAKEARVPVRIAHSHNTSADRNYKYPIKMYYKMQIPKVATDFAACGKAAGDWLFNGNKFAILRNPVDAEKFVFSDDAREKTRADLKLADNAYVIGHVGRFYEQKNHEGLIDIFREVYQRELNSKLLLAGDGPLRKKIEAKVKDLGLEDAVIFLGVTDQIPDLMSAMDVFLLPSLYEGFPVTMVEAQASGLPCFISDTVSSECMLSPDTHAISLKKSPAEWAEKILNTPQQQNRKDGRENVIQAGYGAEKNAKWLESYYLEKLMH